MVLQVLQQGLLRKKPPCVFARLSGQDGAKLTRAAFGTMLKFCDKIESFLKLTEDIAKMARDPAYEGKESQELEKEISELLEN